jgi:uncharacterized protein (TIGR02466 family)
MWGFQWRDAEFLQQIKAYALHLSRTQPSVRKSNFIGWQSHDDMHLDPMFAPLCNKILQVANSEVLQDYEHISSERFKIDSLWVNVTPPGGFNMAHIHGCELSGAFYISVPENSGRFVAIDPRQRVSMSTRRIRDQNFPVQPTEGTCIIFPSWLEHYVEPNCSFSNRISISFNLE